MPRPWQRRRNPEDVPTPVAVAVSDYCRRAGVAAPPGEVRDALSLLSEDEDFRVRSLTDAEPAARPLGPHAVVDVLRGTEPQLAVTRQQSGYYELVRELVVALEGDGPEAQPDKPLFAVPAPKREKKAPPPTMEEKIAPKRRAAKEQPPATEDLPALEPARSRELPRPKGRFSVIAPQRKSVDELFEREAKELLASWSRQYPDRFALTRALGDQYGGRKEGQPLRTEDLERALRHHELLDGLEKKEYEAVLAAYSEQRGASSRVSWALGLTVPELHRLVNALGVKDQVEEIRERFRREALAPRNLASRLDLLGRGKYLSDLGIRKRFDDALRGDLKKLLQTCARQASGDEDVLSVAARREGTQAELLRRAVEKLGLQGELSTTR
jgi:hypothetical protein